MKIKDNILRNVDRKKIKNMETKKNVVGIHDKHLVFSGHGFILLRVQPIYICASRDLQKVGYIFFNILDFFFVMYSLIFIGFICEYIKENIENFILR